MAKIKCAVYVRKSTEKGLELEFNSLHNQEESCRSYILSQAFNNWEYHKTYTDEALSGGTMERPALKQMLEDISKGLIQTVVVYKVDRLSRSITDFYNMVQEFDKYGCSFASITQAFDTSTSMGKLTLNMLLSFAQFEREVSSERVRDKIAASKAKGLWTGGMPKLGYDLVDKKLVVNETEAQSVRHIFASYLKCSSLLNLADQLQAEGIRNKEWITTKGEKRGGKPLSASMIHRLLHEKVYIGYIENKRYKKSFKGQHEAIISKELWDRVHAKLSDQNNRGTSRWRKNDNLLSGKIFDAKGCIFTNKSTRKNSLVPRRYYSIKGTYIPTEQLDNMARDVVTEVLNSDLSQLEKNEALSLNQINFESMDYSKRRDFIRVFIDKIIYANGKLTFFLNTSADALADFKDRSFINQKAEQADFIRNCADALIVVEKSIVIHKGHSATVYNAGKTGLMTTGENNHLTVRALAYAWKFKKLYEEGLSTTAIAKGQKVSPRTVYKYLNLAYLSPNIINILMAGTKSIDLQQLFKIASKYDDFADQEQAFGMFA